jgi:hypothetical protein
MVVTLHQGRGTVSHTQEGMTRPQEKEESHNKCPRIPKLVEMNGGPQKEQGRTMDHQEVLQDVEVGDHQGEALVHQGGDLGHQGEVVSDLQEDLDHHMDHLEDLVHQEVDLDPLDLDLLVDPEVLGHEALRPAGIQAGGHRCHHLV